MSHERSTGGPPADHPGTGGDEYPSSVGHAAGGVDPAARGGGESIHRDDCYAIVAGFAFLGALHYAEAFGKPHASEFAETIRDRVPDCDCLHSDRAATDRANAPDIAAAANAATSPNG